MFWTLFCTVKELSALHTKHLNRPTLDDSVDEEHAIQIQTSEITQVCLTMINLLRVVISSGVMHS